MKAHVTVTLKTGVLDPQGKAIEGALSTLGFSDVESVRQGRYFEIDLPGADETTARQTVEAMCERLLANTVIETYAVDIVD